MHALTTALALLLSCAACAVPQRGEAILRQRGSAARLAGHKLWPCSAWLRLRGAGSDGPECKGAESPRAVHVLTRKMEDVWRTADVLRRRRVVAERDIAHRQARPEPRSTRVKIVPAEFPNLLRARGGLLRVLPGRGGPL